MSEDPEDPDDDESPESGEGEAAEPEAEKEAEGAEKTETGSAVLRAIRRREILPISSLLGRCWNLRRYSSLFMDLL